MPDKSKATLKFGEFVAANYRIHGSKQAKGIIRIAFKAHWVEFLGRNSITVV